MTTRGSLPFAGVALAGFMGVGKSTVGPLVADMLGLPWWDLDQRMEAVTGCTVSELFSERGEASFRELEHKVLRAGLSDGPAVVSLGGGALLRADSRLLLQDLRWRIVVLDASWPVVAGRISGSQRPLRVQAGALFRARREHYASLGPAVHTDRLEPELVAERVGRILAEWTRL